MIARVISNKTWVVSLLIVSIIVVSMGCGTIKRYDIGLSGIQDLINNHGNYDRILTENDKYLTSEKCNKIYVDHYGAGNSVLTGYLESITKESENLSSVFSTGYGGMMLESGVSETDLVLDIKNAIAEFDASHGGVYAHDPLDYFDSSEIRERWFLHLKNELETSRIDDDRKKYSIVDIKAFTKSFQREYGNLPDTNHDGEPDVIDTGINENGTPDIIHPDSVGEVEKP
jgi:hypothetical protein